MSLKIKIYGFGSYFSESKSYRDIDILIVHDSSEYQSCIQAIKYKKSILKEIDKSNVSILSKSEELDFDFISKTNAIFLSEVNENSIKNIKHIVKAFKKHIERKNCKNLSVEKFIKK